MILATVSGRLRALKNVMIWFTETWHLKNLKGSIPDGGAKHAI